MPGDMTLANAIDCHVHVVGPLAQFPQTSTRSYTAAEASLETLQSQAGPEGVSRFVIVQASFYGADNSCLLATLDQLGDRGRGVVAMDLNLAIPSTMEEYERRGVRGLRVNLYSKSLLFSPERIADLVQATLEKVPSRRWHVEIIAPASLLVKASKIVTNSRVPVVLDHYGLPGEAPPDSPDGKLLLALVSMPHVWTKLTAPYRASPDPLATKPPGNWLAAFLKAAPDRCLWGSDWPHTPLEADQKGRDHAASYRQIRYAQLVRDFMAALPDPSLAQRILIENPQRLYGFPTS
jgi:predicted TIM-barrel fold metal-dependent hydrolase